MSAVRHGNLARQSASLGIRVSFGTHSLLGIRVPFDLDMWFGIRVPFGMETSLEILWFDQPRSAIIVRYPWLGVQKLLTKGRDTLFLGP